MTPDRVRAEAGFFGDGRPPELEAPLPGHPEWKITANFVRQGDQLVVSSCTISPAGDEIPQGGLTARQLRRATLGDLTRLASQGLVAKLMIAMAPDASGAGDDHMPRHPGRAGRDDHFYAVWAARYAERAAYTPRPIAELAEQHDQPPARLREYIAEARRRGLLTETTPGRSGGQITEKTRALLAESADE
jgi:hypothetical protein